MTTTRASWQAILYDAGGNPWPLRSARVEIEDFSDGTPSVITAQVPDPYRTFAAGAALADIFKPQQARLEVIWTDSAGTETRIGYGYLQAAPSTNGGNPELSVTARGLLQKLDSLRPVSLPPMQAPMCATAIKVIVLGACNALGISPIPVDTSGFTDFELQGWLNLAEINPLKIIQGLVVGRPVAVEIVEDPVNRRIVVRNAAGIGASVATIANGTNLYSIGSRAGTDRAWTAQKVTGEAITAGVTEDTIDDDPVYGVDSGSFYRIVSQASTTSTYVSGIITSKEVRSYALDGSNILVLSTRINTEYSYTAANLLAESEATTWTLTAGVTAISGRVRTRHQFDANNILIETITETWALSGAYLRLSSRVIDTYVWGVDNDSTRRTQIWALVGGYLELSADTTVTIPDTSLPALEGKTFSTAKVEGTYTTANTAALAQYGTLQGPGFSSPYIYTAALALQVATRLTEQSLFDAAAIDVATDYSSGIALGSTVAVTDTNTNVSGTYYVRRRKISLAAAPFRLQLPRLVPGMA